MPCQPPRPSSPGPSPRHPTVGPVPRHRPSPVRSPPPPPPPPPRSVARRSPRPPPPLGRSVPSRRRAAARLILAGGTPAAAQPRHSSAPESARLHIAPPLIRVGATPAAAQPRTSAPLHSSAPADSPRRRLHADLGLSRPNLHSAEEVTRPQDACRAGFAPAESGAAWTPANLGAATRQGQHTPDADASNANAYRPAVHVVQLEIFHARQPQQ